ncbi:MAG: hypothetical protein JW984_06585 [Deltaproteobacteria bacterium]|uniref:Uncharacterized protein n=1 Tax=Candidatus Zymogenus saltonus TaxID=2844893 RepID=A0A9D8KEX5_9DELT|nr:hypothetical protein [Candidatus Zymogenus saltonus]
MAKMKNNIENSIEDRISFLLDNISEDDKADLLCGLLKLSFSGDKEEIQNYIWGWEEAAEINSIPELRQEVLSRYESLKKKLSEKSNV